MCAQNVATPTIILNFREENFRDRKSNHEIHEHIVPRKFGAIRYLRWGAKHLPQTQALPDYTTYERKYTIGFVRSIIGAMKKKTGKQLKQQTKALLHKYIQSNGKINGNTA